MSYNNMGRFGDTQIREVNGAPAHVNDTEAHWIDNMGPLGQCYIRTKSNCKR